MCGFVRAVSGGATTSAALAGGDALPRGAPCTPYTHKCKILQQAVAGAPSCSMHLTRPREGGREREREKERKLYTVSGINFYTVSGINLYAVSGINLYTHMRIHLTLKLASGSVNISL